MSVKLVAYDHKYAQAVADMWNNSAEAWGGLSTKETEATTINTEENSAHLDLTLAQSENDIIGYCKLSVDHQDEGALYIDLLNVRPDFHGKSVGKQLLLDSLDKTIQRGWRRLDLFTWPGNTKAVPLYKKCGFFWEKKDNSTHLINLIPDVLACELVSDYFKTADWYKDSTREIKQEPDSRLDNEFDLWDYSWEKEGKALSMTYSRRGRGLRKIEHDDYSIEVVVENMKLVFGDSYKVKYLFKNKTDQPMEIEIQGQNDKNIKYDFGTTFTLEDTKEIESTFFVDKIDKKQKEEKTHPVVKSIISLNGKPATFMTGIEPVYPVEIEFKTEKKLNRINVENRCYFDFKNQCETAATFEFEVLNTDVLELSDPKFSQPLGKDEKASVMRKIKMSEASLYTPKVLIKVIREDKADFEFTQEIKMILQAEYGKLSGENQDAFVMANGQHRVTLDKETNRISVQMTKCLGSYRIKAPKLGKPFSQEFEQKKASSVTFEEQNDWIQMTVNYESAVMAGISFNRIVKLHGNGIVKRWFELTNTSTKDQDIVIADGMYFPSQKMITAFDDKILSLKYDTNDDPGSLESSRFTENWLHTSTHNRNYGFVWPENYNMQIADYEYVLECDLKTVKIGDKIITDPMTIGADSFRDWHDVREYALGKSLEVTPVIMASEFCVNNYNPIASDKIEVKFNEYRTVDSKGCISANLDGQCKSKDITEDKGSCTLELELRKDQNLIHLEGQIASDHMSMNRMVYKQDGNPVKQTINEEEGLSVYHVNNGLIDISCAPEFAPSIFSMTHNKVEWLKSSFPKVQPFAWWKSWMGGYSYRPTDINLQSVEEETSTCQFVEKKDTVGNVWSGIEITTYVKENQKHKDIEWKQYYLMISGVPILAHYSTFINHNNVFTTDKQMICESFFDSPKEDGLSHFKFEDGLGMSQKIFSGQYEKDYESTHTYEYHKDQVTDFLTLFKGQKAGRRGVFTGIDMNGFFGVSDISVESKVEKSTQPEFIIFGDQTIKEDWLTDFEHISFK